MMRPAAVGLMILVTVGCKSQPNSNAAASASASGNNEAPPASAAPPPSAEAPKPSPSGGVKDGAQPLSATGGKLAPAEIQKAMRAHYPKYRDCYKKALVAKPSLAGTVKVRFTIGKDGAVGLAGNAGSDMPDASVVKCVVQETYKLKFPKPEGGIVNVTYPIVFSPS